MRAMSQAQIYWSKKSRLVALAINKEKILDVIFEWTLAWAILAIMCVGGYLVALALRYIGMIP